MNPFGDGGAAMKYTEENLNGLDKETLIQLFLSQQEQLERIDHTLQLVLEQMSDLKRHRFGRSTEKHEIGEQISFMEVDGNIVFFNEAEAAAGEEVADGTEAAMHKKPQKKKGKREEELEGLPVVMIEHSMSEEELKDRFGKDGWKQLPDEVYRRYSFTPAKAEVEEHHVKVYAGKKTDCCHKFTDRCCCHYEIAHDHAGRKSQQNTYNSYRNIICHTRQTGQSKHLQAQAAPKNQDIKDSTIPLLCRQKKQQGNSSQHNDVILHDPFIGTAQNKDSNGNQYSQLCPRV